MTDVTITRVEQRHSYDCLRACLATILRLPYDEVPAAVSPPVTDWTDPEEVRRAGAPQHAAMQAFLRGRGLIVWSFALHGLATPLVRFGNDEPAWHLVPPTYWLASVRSPRTGHPHVVVMCHSRIAWDPHPGRDAGHDGFIEAHVPMHLPLAVAA